MTAFAVATDLIFLDPNVGADALYFQGGVGGGEPVRVVRRSPDRVAEFNGGRFVSASMLIDVRVSEVANLRRGDRFEIAGERFEILGEPTRDSERLVWKAEAREV